MITEAKRRAKVKPYTASEITRVAMNILKYEYGAEVWRNNNLAVRGRAFIGKRGAGDLTGYTKDRCIRVECEVKTLTDTFSKDQIKFLTEIHEAGGVALVAYQEGLNVVVKTFFQYQELKKAA